MTKHLKVGAVIVTYQCPADALTDLLLKIADEVERICVVVNEAGTANHEPLQARFPEVHWVLNDTNQGLAAAQNQGIELLLPHVDAVLLLDQDTRPHAGSIEALKETLLLPLQGGERIAAVGPAYTDAVTDHWPGFVQQRPWHFARVRAAPGQLTVAADFLIASGMLIPAEVLNTVGLMDASLFIDHVDTEWCLRAASLDYRLLGTESARFTHSLGDKRHRIWFGRTRQVSTHTPWRYYMSYRNSALLLARPYMPTSWRRAATVRLLGLAGFVALVGPHRRHSLLHMWRGWRDGRAGKSGPPPKIGESA